MSKIYYPNERFAKGARVASFEDYLSLCDEARNDYEGFWRRYGDEKIDWFSPYEEVLDQTNAPHYRWFTKGKMNVSYQCIDRHLQSKGDKEAILFVGDRGDEQIISFKRLHQEVSKMANLLRNRFGINKGDRVVLYMPMIPEAAYAMLACARLGAIHSVVFGGFSAEALKDRIDDAKAKLVITADGAYRKGKPYMLKPVVDEAIEGLESVESVLVVKRNNEQVAWGEKDYCYNELIINEEPTCEAVAVDAEDPLFLLYTSGSTGRPKGVQHSSAGYILWAQMTTEWVFDTKEDDRLWCTADIGWITGHTYTLYGPLAAGIATVMFEGVVTYPDASRAWEIVDKYGVTQFYTAPTAIRLLHKTGSHFPAQYSLDSLRVLGTVGEPIDNAAWEWYYHEVGKGRCPIVDTYWQTETGGHMITPLPQATPIKPSYATFALPGIIAEILDENGNEVPAGKKGLMCITKPWPSMIRTIWGDDERYRDAYFSEVKKDGQWVYFTGDGAFRDEDGYIKITGRVDDVINVSGHRIGTAEIENAIKRVEQVAVSAVVGMPHEIKGEGIFAYVVPKEPDMDHHELWEKINTVLKEEIGSIALLDEILLVPDVPKTRSGKIMRRLLRSLAKGEAITQDISTLEEPEIIAIIENNLKKARSSK